jgi:hypothetical protein
MNFAKHVISVLVVSCIILLVFTSGCIGDNKSKAGFGNVSIGKPTAVTIGLTDTETLETTTPTVTSTTIDLGCLGSKNCGFGPQCYNNCLKEVDGPPTQRDYDSCHTICCTSYCIDLPAGSLSQKACSKDCEKELAEFVKTPTPTKTLRPPNIDW